MAGGAEIGDELAQGRWLFSGQRLARTTTGSPTAVPSSRILPSRGTAPASRWRRPGLGGRGDRHRARGSRRETDRPSCPRSPRLVPRWLHPAAAAVETSIPHIAHRRTSPSAGPHRQTTNRRHRRRSRRPHRRRTRPLDTQPLPARPLHARLPDGTDPADLLALGGPRALTEALTASQPLAEQLLAERMANLPPADAVLEATRIVAARPSHYWQQGSSAISAQLGVPTAQVRCSLLTLVQEWNTDPRRAAQQPLQAIGDVKRRIAAAIERPAGQPRTAPDRGLDQRLHQNPGSQRRTKSEGRRVPLSSRTGTPRARAR